MEIRKAEEKDIPLVCQMAATRMKDAKEASSLLEGINDKEGLMFNSLSAQLSDVYRIGEIWIAGEYQGFLAGYYRKKTNLINTIRSILDMNSKIGKTNKEDLKQFQANMKKSSGTQNLSWRKKECKGSDFFYIQLVAIEKNSKGSGILRKLIDPILMRCEGEKVPVLIDTHDKENVPIYEHFGFELVAERPSKNDASIVQYSMIKRV